MKNKMKNILLRILVTAALAMLLAGAWYVGRNQDRLVDNTIVAAKGKVDQTIDRARDTENQAVAHVAKAEYTVEDRLAAKLNERVQSRVQSRSTETRVEFVVATKRSKALLPGLTLTLEATDPERQHFDGFVVFNGSKVPLENQEARIPFVIYPKGGGEPLHLVIDEVRSDGVKGYLVAPKA